MRSLSSPTLAALAQPEVLLVQLILLQFPSGTLALNSSNWHLTWDGIIYQGASGLGEISAIEDSPGEVKGLQFTLSGASAASISLALDDASEWPGTPITIRTAVLSAATGQIVDAPLDWVGRGDTMGISEDGGTCRVTATAESTAVDLLRGSPLTTSHADQQSVSPGDRAFEYVASQADQPVVWPAKEWFYR
jgi:hypothetical protein